MNTLSHFDAVFIFVLGFVLMNPMSAPVGVLILAVVLIVIKVVRLRLARGRARR